MGELAGVRAGDGNGGSEPVRAIEPLSLTPIGLMDDELGVEQKDALCRPTVHGRSLFIDDAKLHVRGCTYGTFRNGGFPRPKVVESDFATMAENGFNAVRTYTVPPKGVLDLAQAHGLRVMVGLPWEQHVAFLGVRRSADIVDRVRACVSACAGHPAILCYAVGNEIPASITRWYGSRRIERFVNHLGRAAKSEDPD